MTYVDRSIFVFASAVCRLRSKSLLKFSSHKFTSRIFSGDNVIDGIFGFFSDSFGILIETEYLLFKSIGHWPIDSFLFITFFE